MKKNYVDDDFNEKLVEWHRYFHSIPEVGFDVDKTISFIIMKLKQWGVDYTLHNNNILTCYLGNGSKTLLLRSDTDALPIQENTDLEYKSTNCNMHACGHDLHMAMLLGAIKLLAEEESKLSCKVVFLFQPAEEISAGAKEALNCPIVRNSDAAIMLHCYPGIDVKPGTILIPSEGNVTLCNDLLTIEIVGHGGHGAMPETCVDSISIASHLVLNIMNIQSREISALESAIITFGKIYGGSVGNIIPEKVYLSGTIRTFDKEVQGFVHDRINQIAFGTAKTFRGNVEVVIEEGCPSVICNAALIKYISNTLNKDEIYNAPLEKYFNKGKIMFSEDFAYLSEVIPSALLLISSGKIEDGYCYPLHHPKALFDEFTMANGVNALVDLAINFNKV